MNLIAEHIRTVLDRKFPAALVAALLFATPALAAEDCALKQLASLDMLIFANDSMVVPVDVGGTPEWFGVDIGSTLSSVTKAAVDKLKLETSEINNKIHLGVGKQAFTAQATLPRLKLGSLIVDDTKMLVFPNFPNANSDVAGVLGDDFLDNFDVEFDFKNLKVNLFSPDHCAGGVVYWTNSAAAVIPFAVNRIDGPIFDAELDGKAVRGGLSFFGSHSAMSMALATHLFGIDANTKGVTLVQGTNIYRYTFKSLSMEGMEIGDPSIDLYQNYAQCDENFRPKFGARRGSCLVTDVRVGPMELEKLHLYFAFKEQKLYLTAADAHR